MTEQDLPTLFVKGKLKALDGQTQKDLDDYIPIDYILQYFDRPINSYKDRILLLHSTTGTGKSTTLPNAIYEKYVNKEDYNLRKICVTEPRIANVISISKDLDSADWNKLELGKNLSYKTGAFSLFSGERGIIFMTAGILHEQLKNSIDEQFLKKYSFILLDEVHVRDSVEIDLTFFYLKRLLQKHYADKLCPYLILMSGTFNIDKYAKYFDISVTDNAIKVEGSSFPIENIFLKYDSQNYLKDMTELIKSSKGQDVIVFIHKTKLISDACEMLAKARSKRSNYEVIRVTSDLLNRGGEDIDKIFMDPSELDTDYRIFVTTPAFETGITLNWLKSCIDTGYVLTVEFNPNIGCTTIISKPVTKGMALQRRGRVGRKSDGIWTPLYTEETFNSLDEDQIPSILNSDITKNLLSLLSGEKFGYGNNTQNKELSLDLLDNPAPDMFDYSLKKLFTLGLIDRNLHQTSLGIICNRIRNLSVENFKMIVFGSIYNQEYVNDLIILATFLESDFKFQFKLIKKLNSDSKINSVILTDNFILLIYLYNEIIDNLKKNKLQKYCKDNFLNYSDVLQILRKKNEIEIQLMINRIPIGHKIIFDNNISESWIQYIKQCIYEGYKLNLMILNEAGTSYISEQTGITIGVKSALQYFKNLESNPKFIVTDAITFRNVPMTDKNIFSFNTNFVSPLDGYVGLT